jgi:hypothetical protein
VACRHAAVLFTVLVVFITVNLADCCLLLLQRTIKPFQLARQLLAALACGMSHAAVLFAVLVALIAVNLTNCCLLLLQRTIKPFQLARQLSAASGEPNHGYGLLLMPRKLGATPGVIIGIVWSTDDWEQLDVSEMAGDPVGFSHTCYNYIGVGQDGSLAKS